MGLVRTVDPASYPVTLAEAKNQCRVTNSASDDQLNRLIAAATGWVETYTERSIVEQTWKLTLDGFSDSIRLDRGPVQSVTSVEYTDAEGISRTLDTAVYTVDTSSEPDWLVRNSASAWPATLNAINVVNITYVTGYETVPEDLKHAILLLVAHWFDEREGGAMPMAIEQLLAPYRLNWVGA